MMVVVFGWGAGRRFPRTWVGRRPAAQPLARSLSLSLALSLSLSLSLFLSPSFSLSLARARVCVCARACCACCFGDTPSPSSPFSAHLRKHARRHTAPLTVTRHPVTGRDRVRCGLQVAARLLTVSPPYLPTRRWPRASSLPTSRANGKRSARPTATSSARRGDPAPPLGAARSVA